MEKDYNVWRHKEITQPQIDKYNNKGDKILHC